MFQVTGLSHHAIFASYCNGSQSRPASYQNSHQKAVKNSGKTLRSQHRNQYFGMNVVLLEFTLSTKML